MKFFVFVFFKSNETETINDGIRRSRFLDLFLLVFSLLLGFVGFVSLSLGLLSDLLTVELVGELLLVDLGSKQKHDTDNANGCGKDD